MDGISEPASEFSLTNLTSTTQNNHISLPISRATLQHLAATFWSTGSNEHTLDDLQLYAHYYGRQCRNFYHSYGANLPFHKHEDLIQLGAELCKGCTRQQAVRSLQDRYAPCLGQRDKAEGINGAIDLAARLLLMGDVGRPARNRIFTGRSHRLWTAGTIQDFADRVFSEHRSIRGSGSQMDQAFNARNLEVIGGLRVELTDNIFDHLDLIEFEGDTTVMIFHHASFLNSQQNSLYPAELQRETLQTLALLFPQNGWYEKSKAWYLRATDEADSDMAVFACRPLIMTNFDDFQYWRGRLLRVKRAFDQARPRTLRQWWNDRRDGTQWYALWIVLGFTVFFGLIQSIEGALQVYKSYHPTPTS